MGGFKKSFVVCVPALRRKRRKNKFVGMPQCVNSKIPKIVIAQSTAAGRGN